MKIPIQQLSSKAVINAIDRLDADAKHKIRWIISLYQGQKAANGNGCHQAPRKLFSHKRAVGNGRTVGVFTNASHRTVVPS
jgi:hypothetical protein